MKTQQQADREEQQRIKNLVLNYEKSTETEAGEDGMPTSPTFSPIYMMNPNLMQCYPAFEKRTPPRDTKVDKSAANRTAFRSRKLQLSDVDW